jgi:hypothetical protein
MKCQETEEERMWLRECRFFIYKCTYNRNDAGGESMRRG